MSDHFSQRRERLLQQLTEENLGGVLVTSEVNVRYLTGFTGDSTYLVLSPTKTLIISDGRYTTQLAEECPDLPAHIRSPRQTLPQAVGEVLQKLSLGSVAFDSSNITVAQFETMKENTPGLDWKGEMGRVEKLRAIKDEGELELIREAIRQAEHAFAMFRAMLRGKDTEKELADDLEMYIRRAGGKCSSFPPIVAAGPRAALPHAQPGANRLDEENMLLVDWGAAGPSTYKSDLTRVLIQCTKATSSSAGNDLRKVYDVVRRAQQKAIETLRPGVKGGEVDAAARRVIEEAGYGDNFTHSIGHGIGLQVHETPLMRPGSDIEIQAGMVVTVEPGIYFPNKFGVRIEDDVLVTPDGRQVLTSVPREYDEQVLEW